MRTVASLKALFSQMQLGVHAPFESALDLCHGRPVPAAFNADRLQWPADRCATAQRRSCANIIERQACVPTDPMHAVNRFKPYSCVIRAKPGPHLGHPLATPCAA